MESTAAAPAVGEDIVTAIQNVLKESPEPLTVSKIRAQLPAQFRSTNIEDVLRRQVAANVLQLYPKYRSQHERFWDRPMTVHIAALVREALQDGALAPNELRRKLPAYAQAQTESVLQEELAKGRLHRHPRATARGGERVGLAPPDPKEYLAPELSALLHRLQPLGFSVSKLRAAALELLHNEEWAPSPPQPRPERKAIGEERTAAVAAGTALPAEQEPTRPNQQSEVH
jgi:hypothetical protein